MKATTNSGSTKQVTSTRAFISRPRTGQPATGTKTRGRSSFSLRSRAVANPDQLRPL